MRKISATILALSTLSLIGCSSETAPRPLDQFLGVTVPELDADAAVVVDERVDGAAAWVARYDNLDREQLGDWIEDNQPGEVAGMTLRAATTGDSYRVDNEELGLTLEGDQVWCYASERDPDTFLAENRVIISVLHDDRSEAGYLDMLGNSNSYGCQDTEYELNRTEIDRRAMQGSQHSEPGQTGSLERMIEGAFRGALEGAFG